MKVGDKVFLKAVGNMARGRKETYIKESEISKVGRKYIEIDGGTKPFKFRIDDMQQENGGYSADWKLYFSKQDILDEEEKERISWDIKMKFSGYKDVDLTLDQLRRIEAIIKE